MSATNRGAERALNDAYNTPAWCVEAALRNIPDLTPGWWLEPCAGCGLVIDGVKGMMPDVKFHAVELDKRFRPALEDVGADVIQCPTDFLSGSHVPIGSRFEVCITNPPYSRAQEFIEASLRMCRKVVMLLRLNYLGGQRRNAFMRANPPDVYVLSRRPSFISASSDFAGGTDATEYAWFVWTRKEKREVGQIKVMDLSFLGGHFLKEGTEEEAVEAEEEATKEAPETPAQTVEATQVLPDKAEVKVALEVVPDGKTHDEARPGTSLGAKAGDVKVTPGSGSLTTPSPQDIAKAVAEKQLQKNGPAESAASPGKG